MGAGRRATSPTAPDRKSKFPVVTCVAVDENYNFPRSELAAMAKNISRLIDDIDRLDINRRNMMDELKVLRDVTLFYNEAHPELLAAAKKPATEDAERGTRQVFRQHNTGEVHNTRDAEDTNENSVEITGSDKGKVPRFNEEDDGDRKMTRTPQEDNDHGDPRDQLLLNH